MRQVSRAILLLAGRGNRLASLTQDRPKCLLELAGVSILERALQSLSLVGVTEAILVIGYQADQIRGVIGCKYAGINIRYIINNRYAETNTAYSLWLTKDYLNADCLLLEGDILFEVKTLERVLDFSADRSVWAVMPVTPGNDEGILLQRTDAGYVAAVQLVRQTEHRAPVLSYKCAGIQLLNEKLAQSLATKLDEIISSGQTRIFADLVLGEILNEKSMKLCSLAGLRWAEIDTSEDFYRAQQLFRGGDTSDLIIFRELIVEDQRDE